MLKKVLLLGTAFAALSVTAANAGTLWVATMTGAGEPVPTGSTFTGTGFLLLNDAETSAAVYGNHTVPAGPPGPNVATVGHIHRGPAGVNGPVIFPFATPPLSPFGPLTWAIPTADVANLKTGGLYFNIHNGQFPGGVIRGQIVRFQVAASATNAAQTAVANALDVSANRNTDLDQVLMSQVAMSGTARTQSLDDLSARTVYAQGRQATDTMAGFEDNLFGHMESRTEAAEGFSGYFSGGNDFGKRDTEADQAGSKTSRPFILAGFDYGYGAGTSVGIGVGYADGEDKFRNGVGKTNAKTIAVLGHFAAESDGIEFSAVGGYGWTDFDTSRSLTTLSRTATSSHDGSVWSIGAKVAVPFELDNDATLAPYGMVDAQHARVDAYTETGANSVNLVIPRLADKIAAGEIGATFVVPMGANGGTVASLQGGWRYLLESGRETFNATLAGSGTPFAVNVLSPGRSAAHVAAGITANLGGNSTGSIGYRGLISSRTSIHAIEARLTLRM